MQLTLPKTPKQSSEQEVKEKYLKNVFLFILNVKVTQIITLRFTRSTKLENNIFAVIVINEMIIDALFSGSTDPVFANISVT